MTKETEPTNLQAENALLRAELAWCLPRLSRGRYRAAVQSFLSQRGIQIDLPPKDKDQNLDADQSQTTVDPVALELAARKWMNAENAAAKERREGGTSKTVSQTQCDALAAKRELRLLLGGCQDP